MNPYEVLGVPENADDATVKKAYRELVKKYHPDWLAEKTASGTAAGGGVVQTESQSNDPQRTPPRKSGKTKTGGSSLRTALERKPCRSSNLRICLQARFKTHIRSLMRT